jgi:hypothetical protein
MTASLHPRQNLILPQVLLLKRPVLHQHCPHQRHRLHGLHQSPLSQSRPHLRLQKPNIVPPLKTGSDVLRHRMRRFLVRILFNLWFDTLADLHRDNRKTDGSVEIEGLRTLQDAPNHCEG